MTIAHGVLDITIQELGWPYLPPTPKHGTSLYRDRPWLLRTPTSADIWMLLKYIRLAKRRYIHPVFLFNQVKATKSIQSHVQIRTI